MVFNSRKGSADESAAELRAVERRVFRKRRALWLGYLVVLVSLVVLLALQSLWLADLQESSIIARKTIMRNFLDAVAKEVHVYYLKISERALNISADSLASGRIQKAGYHFKKKAIRGARRLFVVSFVDDGATFFYNPATEEMDIPEFSSETLAVWAAAAPWKIVAKKGAAVETTTFSVDQRDPHNRIILNPITNEDWEIVGLAGMIVDEGFFSTELLPKAIAMTIPKSAEDKGLVVTVRDQNGRVVIPCTGHAKPKDDVVRDNFSFIFTDWVVGLQGNFASPERWARTNFIFNMSLSALLAVVLVSGISLTLRTASREMKLSTMKNDFVSNVSHELRTPLSSIRVFGEFMRLGRVTDPDKVREYGEIIETESRRLTQLINNILDFSRIESGQRVYRYTAADLEEVVAETLATFGVRLKKGGFEVSYHAPDEPLPDLVMDSNAIGRALANLVDNAVKYSDGNRLIEVTLGRDDSHATVSVRDHGVGIAKDEQKRIFERFHRVSTGLVHDVKGSGLGLSLVQHIVAAHGGTVEVSSEPGRGSTFTIRLPLQAPPGSAGPGTDKELA